MFKAWPKIPRLENEIYHITEKIDGTNSAIIIQPYNIEFMSGQVPEPLTTIEITGIKYYIWAQSRTRLITPEDDNFGFAKWVRDNAEQLIKDLGVGYHYGEWWGKGIQRGYGLEERRFSLFNTTKHSTICSHVPLLCSCEQYALMSDINACIATLKDGSIAVPGYMQPEGLVIYAEKAKTYWKVIIDK